MRLEASKKALLVHVPQGAAKLQAVKLFQFSKIVHFCLCIIFSFENSTTYEHFWFWHPVTFQPLDSHGQIIPFWKPPISHCLEPGGHRGGISFFIFKTVKSFPILCVIMIWINDLAYLELQVIIVNFCFFDRPSGVYFIYTMLILNDSQSM